MLEMEGFSVRTAADGKEAIDMMREEKPDLLLCDLMMPVMNGFEVTEAVKKDKALKSVPVLILTALKAEKEQARLEALGADGFATKPFDRKGLTAEIRRLTGS